MYPRAGTALARAPARARDPGAGVHGRRDPFFPIGNGEALAREIPGARLLALEQAATAIPTAAVDEVAAEKVGL
jgi:pimeloyl-ACP methyl ester carboxylesterase